MKKMYLRRGTTDEVLQGQNTWPYEYQWGTTRRLSAMNAQHVFEAKMFERYTGIKLEPGEIVEVTSIKFKTKKIK